MKLFLALLFCLSLVHIARADIGKFSIPPFVYTVGGNQVGVSWKLASRDPGKQGKLSVFKDRALIAEPTVVTTSSGISHSILPVPSCGFGDRYSYEVEGASYTLTDIPCAGSHDTARFSFLADTQEGPEIAHQFALEIENFPGSVVVHGGDIVQTGNQDTDWEAYFQAMDPLGGSRVLVPTVGNHEYRYDPTVPLYTALFQTPVSQMHYAIDVGAAHIVVINSGFEDDPSLIQSQLPWLHEELAKNYPWKIVVFHHPPFSVGFFNSPLAPKKEWKYLQQYYVPLFELYGVKLVLCGHTHVFERSYRNGITYITEGPAGGKMGVVANVNPYSVLHDDVRTVTNFEVDPHAIRAVTLDENGKTIDDVVLE